MTKFILNKFIYGLLVLIGVVFVIFALFNILPVDPARLTLGQRADVESVEAINKELGLDKPKYVQFALYLNELSPIAIHDNTAAAKEKYHYTKIFNIGLNSVRMRSGFHCTPQVAHKIAVGDGEPAGNKLTEDHKHLAAHE